MPHRRAAGKLTRHLKQAGVALAAVAGLHAVAADMGWAVDSSRVGHHQLGGGGRRCAPRSREGQPTLLPAGTLGGPREVWYKQAVHPRKDDSTGSQPSQAAHALQPDASAEDPLRACCSRGCRP